MEELTSLFSISKSCFTLPATMLVFGLISRAFFKMADRSRSRALGLWGLGKNFSLSVRPIRSWNFLIPNFAMIVLACKIIENTLYLVNTGVFEIICLFLNRNCFRALKTELSHGIKPYDQVI